MRFAFALRSTLFVMLLAGLPANAQTLELSRSPREQGLAVLRELWLEEGKLRFRVDSNGCTDLESFRIQVGRQKGLGARAAHYQLAIQRVRVDECKAMLWEGVVIELDLEKDVGLAGTYTLSVTNPVLPKEGNRP